MTSRRMIIGLGAGFLMLGAALAYGAISTGAPDDVGSGPRPAAIDIGPRAVPPAPPERVPSGNPLWAIPLKDLSATRDRPLFSPSRRPSAPAVAAAPFKLAAAAKPAEPDRPKLALVGTISGDGEGIGIFLDPSNNKIVRLKTGDAHNGWILRRVERRETLLEKNDQTAVLALPVPGAPPAPGTKVAADPSGRWSRR
jgi:general secretion pathway protein N